MLTRFGILLALIALTYSSRTKAQNALTWSVNAVKVGKGLYDIHMTASLGSGWHTYSAETPPGGPVPTEISINQNPLIEMDGDVDEYGKLDKHFEPLFGVNVLQYSNKVEFVQRVRLKHPVKINLSGKIRYMVCNDHECLPPAIKEFTVLLRS